MTLVTVFDNDKQDHDLLIIPDICVLHMPAHVE